ncbi:unnamed protein product [Camellia sinensis]
MRCLQKFDIIHASILFLRIVLEQLMVPTYLQGCQHQSKYHIGGTANDSRVFIETVHDPTNLFPMPPTDKYYVVDSGYTNMPGFLSPYCGDRYHLNEFRNQRRQPRNKKQMFNYRHSSLRNVIERCFGVLKARFPILRDMPPYSTKT